MTLSRAEAEDFLYREARLIDEWRLKDWNAMFTADGLYWLPVDENAEPGTHVSLIHDNALRREERVYRLLETAAHSQDPRSATQHFISNVSVPHDENGQVRVYSSQIIYEIRAHGADYRHLGLGEQRSFAARCEHLLRMEHGSWKIALKKMVLLNRGVAIGNLTFIL